ncbi:histidinol-phosphate transaminase [Nocardia brasiliensis]
MDELMGLVRPAIREMTPYSSARTEGSQIAMRVRLDANESPYPPYPGGVEQQELNRYPEGQPELLLDIFATFYGVPRESLLFSRGADEAIDLLVRGFCAEGKDQVLCTPPTFAMYRHSAQVQGVDVLEVPLTLPDFQLDVSGILRAHAGNPRTKLLFFCSPNNPTANLLNRADILYIATKLFGSAIVVVDELYLDYSNAESLADAIGKHPNIVVLRSMSKEYSLAGERFGITIAHPDIISVLGRMIAPYPLSQSAIRAVTHVMTSEGMVYAKAKIDMILSERARVARELGTRSATVRVFHSDANFLLVQVTDAPTLVGAMERNGIKIRDRSTLAGAENAVRISIGTPQENDAMLAVFDQFSAMSTVSHQ